MNEIDFRGLDLNLLRVFHAVYRFGQVTRAAEALSLTQPAVSHALGRLRAVFGDPLFVRASARMRPTPKAHDIAGPIGDILRGIQDVVNAGQAFDPARARRTVRIGMLDYGIALFAARIARAVAARAPHVRVDFRHTETGAALDMLAAGRLDLGIGPFGPLPRDFRRHVVLRSGCVVVARQGHPFTGPTLSVGDYCAMDHVSFLNLPAIDNQVDEYLAAKGLSRRIVTSVPHYSSALFVVSASDLVATISRGPARLFRDFLGLRLYDPPIPLALNEISMVRHTGQEDPLIDWLWAQIQDIRVPD